MLCHNEEGTRLRVLENGVQRKTFGPERHEVTRGWRRSHTEELHDWHTLTDCTDDQIKRNGTGVACGM